jgi:hypothetical protein
LEFKFGQATLIVDQTKAFKTRNSLGAADFSGQIPVLNLLPYGQNSAYFLFHQGSSAGFWSRA